MGADHSKNGINNQYMAIPSTYTETSSSGNNKRTDITKWLKNISIVVGLVITLGGLVWGAAIWSSSFLKKDDHQKLEDRVEIIENNVIKQTVILDETKKTVDRIEKKLDNYLIRKD